MSSDPDTAKAGINVPLDCSCKQLEAAKQRELELLAVIEKLRSALLPYCDGACPDYDIGDIDESYWAAARAAIAVEPSHALREHEAEVVAEYKQRAEAAEAKLRELEMQKPQAFALIVDGAFCSAHRHKYDAEHEGMEIGARFDVIPLYAKPFPSKQEEK